MSMAAFHGNPALLTRPSSPVILQATPGNFGALSDAVQSLALNRVFTASRFGSLSLFRGFRIQSVGVSMPEFGMLSASLSGPALARLLETPLVQNAWEDAPISISQFPAAPASQSWTIPVPLGGTLTFTSSAVVRSLVGADAANSAGYDGSGTTSAVVDTGVAPANPQLRRVLPLTVLPGDHLDFVGHGSFCCSALGGARSIDPVFSHLVGSTVEVEGMAPGTRLVAIKAMDFPGSAPTSQLLAGLHLAYELQPDVLSLSWGGPPSGTQADQDVFYAPIQAFLQKGTIVCAAIGNSGAKGPGAVDSPGTLPGVLGVAAYNAVTNYGWNGMFGAAGTPCGFSSYGPSPYGTPGPSLIMPGAVFDSGVSGLYLNEMSLSYSNVPHSFQCLAGTSMATPVAAGLLACMRQAHRKLVGATLTNPEVLAMLQSTGAEQDPKTGYGALTWDLYRSWMRSQYGVRI